MPLRSSMLIFLAAVMASSPASAQRPIVEDRTEEGARHYLEGHMPTYVGAADVEAALRARSSIMALGAYGEFATSVPHGLLIRERSGWVSRSRGQSRPLAPEVSREIDRILASSAFWREQSYDPAQNCTGGARLMTVRHAGRVKTSRQSCGGSGIAGRLSEIAVSGRIPAPPPEVRPEPPLRPALPSANEREFPTQDPAVSNEIWSRTEAAIAAWNRGDIDAFLAPYAADVTIVWPTGMEYNKRALQARTRAAQRWNGRPEREMTIGTSTIRQLGPHAALQTYQLRFSGGSRRETQMWVTAIWQNRRGTWEVTHEQPGAETMGWTR